MCCYRKGLQMRESKFKLIRKVFVLTIVMLLFMNVIPVKAASKNMWLEKYYITVDVGKTGVIGIKGNTTGKKVTYTSNDEKIATVSSKGVIKGVKAGKVTIFVKAGNVTRKCIVTVKTAWIAAKSIEFNEEVISLDIGEKVSNPAKISPSNASSKWVTYTSDDPTVASVNSEGMVIGVGEGKTIITAKGNGGVKGISEVFVSQYEYEEIDNRKPEVYDSTLVVKQGKVKLGMKKSELINSFGEPAMILDSEFNCPVYIYNDDYSSLVFVYVKSDDVIGYYTNATQFEACGIKSTYDLEEISRVTLDYGGCKTSDYINRMWHDVNNELTSILVMIPSIDPDELTTFYLPTAGSNIITNMEKMYFELVNGFRGRKGIPSVYFDNEMSNVSRSHSKDMTKRDYFSHNSPEGVTPFERLQNAGISYTMAAEIITGDMCLSTLYNISSFIGSPGHYEVMMDAKYTKAGPGVSLGDIEMEEFGNITILFR